ncbi:hypothetical protein RHSIM_Rhsim01G0246300 [Rhododendron simsii]|uniref:Uncharacterized protein n=1 Tax=Rhododendron simsii TaxID=118357 RepID=A0A834HJH1_RHOSS|nr:hypothetical protein RHSIM_Rhsim01G0246300 [Rhododendron simsii]
MAHSSKSNSTGVRSGGSDRFSDVFGGPPKYNGKSASPLSDFDYDSIFNSTLRGANDSRSKPSSSPPPPVYDKPVYDEDIFDGLPGLKSKPMSSSARYEDDVFAAGTSSPRNQSKSQGQKQSGAFDDLIGSLGRTNKKFETKNGRSSGGFDDLLPGISAACFLHRPLSEAARVQKTTFNATRLASAAKEDPFVVLESNSTPAVSSPRLFADPLEEISKPSNSGNTKIRGSSVSGGAFDDIDPLDGFGKSFPASSSGIENNVKDGSPSRMGSNIGRSQTSSSTETIGKSSFKDSGRHSQKVYANNFQESNVFDVPSVSTDARKSVSQTASASCVYSKSGEKNSKVEGVFPESHESMEPSDDIWITVSEVPLFTKPTSAPPPSRPPPPIPGRASKSEAGFSTPTARKKGTDSSSFAPGKYSQSPKPTRPPMKRAVGSQIDELKDFAIGTARSNDDESEEVNTNSSGAAASAAAMKEAMDRAEAKFRHAKEVRDKECAKTSRTKEAVHLEKDEQAMPDDQEREYRGNPERLDRERRLREEEERERRILEKEREKAREIEREREKAKQAVERATREARERAAAETRERAAAEVRLKTERIAVHKVQALARERAAVEARERAEKVAADAREKANVEARDKELKEKAAAAAARAESEARRRAERAAVERAAAEARERAAAGARERAAAARMDQQKNDDDLESFFNVSRPGSAPKPRESSPFSDIVLRNILSALSSDLAFNFQYSMPDPRFQNKGGPEGTRKTSPVGASSNGRKAPSATNIVDDLTEIFGAAPSSGEFQNIDGESDERRRARLERHQRTKERAAKALAEKNQRDLQTQRDQDERHRIGETLDIEIKRWAAGKEGNLRALLSTMQYVLNVLTIILHSLNDDQVLWPECGWQPVSLTDLITGASVKKVYRRANLCIHPDKVQQKGATLHQKYIAEKVFDLLKVIVHLLSNFKWSFSRLYWSFSLLMVILAFIDWQFEEAVKFNMKFRISFVPLMLYNRRLGTSLIQRSSFEFYHIYEYVEVGMIFGVEYTVGAPHSDLHISSHLQR